MTSPVRPSIWFPLAILAVALIAWAAMFAAGAYLEIGADNPRYDIRKPLIILASMLTFLGLWGLALWMRKHRRSK